MKITKTQLRQVVKEELAQLDEFFGPWKKKSLLDWGREIEGFHHNEVHAKLAGWEDEMDDILDWLPDNFRKAVEEVREQWRAKTNTKMTHDDALEYFADMMDTMATLTKRLGAAAERKMDQSARRRHAELQDKLNREADRAIEAWEEAEVRKKLAWMEEPPDKREDPDHWNPVAGSGHKGYGESISRENLRKIIKEEIQAVLESK